jgi:hypothetical protein
MEDVLDTYLVRVNNAAAAIASNNATATPADNAAVADNSATAAVVDISAIVAANAIDDRSAAVTVAVAASSAATGKRCSLVDTPR